MRKRHILLGNWFAVPNHLLGTKKALQGGVLSRFGCGFDSPPASVCKTSFRRWLGRSFP